jgi:predicted lysophospholipase L1 biosynthesis ABC-type transport system permease subunit
MSSEQFDIGDEVANVCAVIAGFAVGYFQQPWGIKSGFGMSFGIQAVIVAVAMVIVALLQVYGGWLRAKGGPVV